MFEKRVAGRHSALSTFRDKGYDGASLAELSTATGLGRSSLYHYFPGGKEEMAQQVLAHLDAQLATALFAPLRSGQTPARRLAGMLATLHAFYDGGRKACLLERLCASVDSGRFRRPLSHAFSTWIDAVEQLCLEAGLHKTVARSRAQDLVVRVEGALVVCAGTGELEVFERTLRELRATLLAPAKKA
jgi:AcrR family transcriptional regulator